MKIKSLKIRNFRNYENASLSFEKGIHFIVGKNGQGKTNLLESIYYLSCTKSHRTSTVKDLIKEDNDFFILDASIIKNDIKTDIRCVVNDNGKNLFVYKNPIKKVSEFIGILNAVMFCPNDMYLFNGLPKERRKFVDLELGKLSKTYTNMLNTYYKLLKERNAYLKRDSIDRNYIRLLDDRLIECQLTIIRQRKKFIDDIIKNSFSFYEKLSEDHTSISCIYNTVVDYDENMKSKLKEKYEKTYDRDVLYKQTHIGIHKDDFIFMINNHEVASYASQGQKRSVILSLKLGIVKTIYLLSRNYPILLLDDVFSELDEDRRNKLLSLLNDDMQIFISSTDKIDIDKKKNISYWIVENGNIVKED